MTDRDALFARLLEFHRPRKMADALSYREQYLVWCPVCDGSTRHLWQPGDPDIECEYWREGQRITAQRGDKHRRIVRK